MLTRKVLVTLSKVDTASPEYQEFVRLRTLEEYHNKPKTSAYGKSYLGKNVYEAALDRMRYAYESFDNIIVAFSGGKDSTAVLEVALAVARERGALPLDVLFVDEETPVPATVEYVERVRQNPDIRFHWLALPLQHRGGFSSEESSVYPWGREFREDWIREPPESAIILEDVIEWYQDPLGLDGKSAGDPRTRLSLEPIADMYCRHLFPKGSIGKALGIRVDESMVRRRSIATSRSHLEHFVKPVSGRIGKVYPVYDWKVSDIWTATLQFGWDYNEMYDFLEMQGVAGSRQRVGNFFGSEGMRALVGLPELFPEHYERMLQRFPGIRTVSMYGYTELYGYKEVVEKPDDIEWPEFLKQIAEESHKDEAALNDALYVVGKTITRHYNKTTDPILEVPHPVSGVDWRVLVKMARLGDGKGRISASIGPGQPGTAEAYAKELRKYRRELRAKRTSDKQH